MNSRDDVLSLLQGKRINRLPVFGVLPSLTALGIKTIGARYSELHTDAAKMASAAATTFQLYGYESAVAPFDLCVEAEALGCKVDFQTDVDAYLAPTIQSPLTNHDFDLSDDLSRLGRITLVADAIRRLKAHVGSRVVIGGWIPGPFTLGWQLFGADAWLSFIGSQDAAPLLERLARWLPLVGRLYRQSGADYIAVHDMGASPQIIGRKRFASLAKPALKNLFARLPSPHVLSICGDTNAIVRDLADCGANAINVDHRNDLARTRQILGPEAVIFGNFDPVGLLSRGKVDAIRIAVEKIAQAGASAIVPGCDLYPDIPNENMCALMESAKQVWA